MLRVKMSGSEFRVMNSHARSAACETAPLRARRERLKTTSGGAFWPRYARGQELTCQIVNVWRGTCMEGRDEAVPMKRTRTLFLAVISLSGLVVAQDRPAGWPRAGD